jgi:hypothetical protein
MKYWLLPLFTAAMAAQANAATQCTFTTECFEAEACTETSFAVSLDETDAGLTLSSDAESFPVALGGSDKVRVYVGFTQSAFHLLTATDTKSARYTTHIYDGPLLVSYLGSCEASE